MVVVYIWYVWIKKLREFDTIVLYYSTRLINSMSDHYHTVNQSELLTQGRAVPIILRYLNLWNSSCVQYGDSARDKLSQLLFNEPFTRTALEILPFTFGIKHINMKHASKHTFRTVGVLIILTSSRCVKHYAE